MHSVLLLNNHTIYRTGLRLLLLYELGVRVLEADTAYSALDLLRREQVDVLVLDTALQDMHYREMIARARELHPTLPVALISPEPAARYTGPPLPTGVTVVGSDTAKEECVEIFITALSATVGLHPVHRTQ